MLLDLTLAAMAVFVSPIKAPHSALVPAADTRATTEAKESGEEIQIQTSDKLSLAAVYYEPSIKGNVKAPGAVLLHEPGADKSELEDLARYLQRKGFGVLVFDLRGHGASVQPQFDWKSMDDKGKEACWALAIRDVEAATNFMRERREIHSNNISLVGVGAGASLAVRQAHDDDTVRALVLVAPTIENYGFNLVTGLGDLAGLPTLIVTSKDQRDEASRLQGAVQRSTEGSPLIEVSVSKAAPEALLGDTSTRASLSTWLKDRVAPKR